MSMISLPPTGNEESELFRKKSLREEVFDLLHRRIIAGKYLPGEWLRQEELSLQLGVSQTPVREALDLLVSAGLAERVPYRGVRVPELSADEIIDAYVLRLVLESAAARLAAINISAEDLELIGEILEQLGDKVTLDEMPAQRQLNKQFHLAIVSASGNQMMAKVYETIANKFPDWRLYEYMFRHPELLDASLRREYEEHRAMVNALRHGDPNAAAAHAVAHIRSLAQELVDYLNVPADRLQNREAQVLPQLGLPHLAK